MYRNHIINRNIYKRAFEDRRRTSQEYTIIKKDKDMHEPEDTQNRVNKEFNKIPIVRKKMTVNERKQVDKIIDGKQDINSTKSQKLLQKPHVAIALEAILDQSGLTDVALARKLNEIIKRRNIIVTPDGTEVKVKGGKQQTAIDANALSGIRLAWQIKGKFRDSDDGLPSRGGMGALTDEQLDKIIVSGMEYIHLRKNRIDGNGNGKGNDDANTKSTGDSGTSS